MCDECSKSRPTEEQQQKWNDDGQFFLTDSGERIHYEVVALWQYLWVERPVQDSAPWKSPRAGVSPTRLRGQFEAQLSEQNMEAAARQHFA